MQTEISALLFEAATLLLVGMCVVFGFLALLIGAIHLIAWVNTKLPAEQQDSFSSARSAPAKAVSSAPGVSPSTIAAIGAAIHQYRKSR